MTIMHRTFHFGLAIVLALSFTLTACDSGSDEEEGADTDPAIGCDDAGAISVQVLPRATYLRSDNAEPAQAFRLSDAGLQPGTRVRLERLGEFQFRDIDPDLVSTRIVAVFSSDDVLLDRTERARVPGAIDAGSDFVTRPTFGSGQATDIPEDFDIDGVDTLTVPENAAFLFVSPNDGKFDDNLDQDEDFRLCITQVN
jgi:hypothetical protein